MAMPLHGLWVSDSPYLACTEDYLDRCHEDLGLDVLAVMLDSSDAPWDARWSPLQFERFCRLAIDRKMEVVGTWWPFPSREILEVALAALDEYLSVGPVGCEPDVEGLWVPWHVRGFACLDEADRALLEGLLALRQKYDVRFEITTHPWTDEGHWTYVEIEAFLEAVRLRSPAMWRDLAPHADRLCWQGYSTSRLPSGEPVVFDGRFGPGSMQRFAFDRAKRVPGDHKIVCGLAAYRQRWQGHDPQDAMHLAYDASLTYDPVEVRWWDSRVVLGSLANGYAYRFLRGLAATRRLATSASPR